MSRYDTLEVTTADHVTTIRLDRPDSLNALNAAMTRELLELLGDLEADEATRAVVLTGNGRGFCAGADLADIAAAAGSGGSPRPFDARRTMRGASARLARALVLFEKPLVAAVNGPCAGAGMGLALAADVLLAGQQASFSVIFVKRGLVPDYGVTYLLPRLVGLRRARELCLRGDRISAEEADRLGLLTDVVADEELLVEAEKEAQRFAAGAGVALQLTKRLLAESFDVDHATAVDREFTAQALCLGSHDATEGAMAFMEKRDPQFRWA